MVLVHAPLGSFYMDDRAPPCDTMSLKDYVCVQEGLLLLHIVVYYCQYEYIMLYVCLFWLNMMQ